MLNVKKNLTNRSTLFELFSGAPDVIREFLHSALQLRDLHKLYSEARVRRQDSLCQALLEILDVDVRVTQQDLDRIPRSGPVVIVANHPFGLLDGLILDAMLSRVRTDTKILTNALLSAIEEMHDRCIPLDVFGGQGALERNFRSIRLAMEWLRDGHCVALFPAGEVSRWSKERRCVTDPPWTTTAVRCAKNAAAPVIPAHFSGENSLAFQMAGFLHPRLRTAMLPGQLLNKRGRTVELVIGTPISPVKLSDFGSLEQATEYLRARTYTLAFRRTAPAPRPFVLPTRKPEPEPIATETQGIAHEIALLKSAGCEILDNNVYSVYAERGDKIPVLLREIGRLRELTFRQVGEGTGNALDLDGFDSYYTHLILWHKETSSIVGSYRLVWTQDVLPAKGIRGLYTSTLFRYVPKFFSNLGPSIELGRSFVRPEYQKDYAPLMLLWQAIARCVARRPGAPALFGAVSISANYSPASQELIVQFLREQSFRSDLAQLVVPRKPFRSRLTRRHELSLIAHCLRDVDDLSAPISDIEDNSGVPVLLRQYLRLGGRVAAFNVDRKFSNALDGLLVVDLRETAPKLLVKYMGAQAAAAFLESARTPYSA